MEESKSGMSWIAVLFIILIIWAIFGGGFGNNWGNRQPVMVDGYNGGCSRVSNCEIEKQEIIDSARTQYLVEQQAAQTRAEVQAGVSSLYDQANRIYIQNLQTEAFDLKMENQSLKDQLYSDAKFTALTNQLSECCCGFNRRLDGIEAQMLTKPTLSGVAVTSFGQLIPASCCNNNF